MTISELHQLFMVSKGLCTDTRKLQPNQLFFAIKGDHFDGNKFAVQAIENGASYAVVQDKDLAKNPKCILVENVLLTLQQLARFHREQFSIPVIGITGTNGKTTSKELVNAVLSEQYNVLVTQGNLNNHLGVPMTLLRLTKNHQIAVIEMGANKPGDIKELADIACPTHGVITNIGKGHLEGFGGLEGVVQTKTELYQNVRVSGGKLFVNTADDLLTKQIGDSDYVIGYGEGSDYVTAHMVSADPFIAFQWKSEAYESPVIHSQLVGGYNLNNFLLAICIGLTFEVSHEAINRGLENYLPSNNRSQVTRTKRNTLIVDCYNANPTSMQSAITSFAAIDATDKMMILGDMLELGDIKEAEHRAVITEIDRLNIETIFVGAIFKAIEPMQTHYATVEEMVGKENLASIKGKTILLKGSRGIRLEKLIELL
ncbi:MAG: UDP-N-acetylmuramoyl-tripeptide--D-alanyl-D-alanine ligase [Putridiphycobacter sp.]|nr:UDP-N-acetylmuramoyl-tripeptide--D-alanyl-D-alanine ligase [Putridiphycobacter sp.]